MDCDYAEPPVIYDFNRTKYAAIYQIKFNSELVYVYIEFYNSCPSFDEFTNAGKSIHTHNFTSPI